MRGAVMVARWYVLWTRLACFRQSGHRPGRAVDTVSATQLPDESHTRSTRTSIPENSASSTVVLATAENTLPKRILVPAADLDIHGTADRAGNQESSSALGCVEDDGQQRGGEESQGLLGHGVRGLLPTGRIGGADAHRGSGG
ncbi:hypothetical protein ABT063_30670 [Streptomyces sp. NPDC002838]|uniref:hypothetical protein n=1 Tax=Streptomyces sp. NPDC002838 TaxID=3154436 RepID=UPI003323E3A3